MTPNGYVAIVESEPIIGIPSQRMYGPYDTSEEAWNALNEAGVITRVLGTTSVTGGFSSAGVLPIRPIDTLKDERP